MSGRPLVRRKIETGAADDDRPQSGARGLGDHGGDFAQPVADRIAAAQATARRADAAHAQVRVVGPRGQDAPAGVDLRGVGIDDAAAVALGDRSASADLPLAVGPAIRTGRGSSG